MNLQKILLCDPEKCVGCRNCMLACSFYHETGEFNLARSRISIIEDSSGRNVQKVCLQCSFPPCAEICPVEAIARNEKTGAMIVNYDICIGCKMCITACPLGAITMDPKTECVIKCDLCGGDPMCVKYCNYEAISFVDIDNIVIKKGELTTKKFSKILEAIV